MNINQWLLVLLAVLSGSVGALLIKSGAALLTIDRGLYVLFESAIINWPLAVGLFLYVLPALIFIYLLRFLDVSLVQPILALTYVVTAGLAIVVHHEKVSLMRMLGIALIILGVALVSRSHQ
jgi:drug/metabolite transporter (DMT)-like permease